MFLSCVLPMIVNHFSHTSTVWTLILIWFPLRSLAWLTAPPFHPWPAWPLDRSGEIGKHVRSHLQEKFPAAGFWGWTLKCGLANPRPSFYLMDFPKSWVVLWSPTITTFHVFCVHPYFANLNYTNQIPQLKDANVLHLAANHVDVYVCICNYLDM